MERRESEEQPDTQHTQHTQTAQNTRKHKLQGKKSKRLEDFFDVLNSTAFNVTSAEMLKDQINRSVFLVCGTITRVNLNTIKKSCTDVV